MQDESISSIHIKVISGVKTCLFLTIIVPSPDEESRDAECQQQQQSYSNSNSSTSRELWGMNWNQHTTFTLWVHSHCCNLSSRAEEFASTLQSLGCKSKNVKVLFQLATQWCHLLFTPFHCSLVHELT